MSRCWFRASDHTDGLARGLFRSEPRASARPNHEKPAAHAATAPPSNSRMRAITVGQADVGREARGERNSPHATATVTGKATASTTPRKPWASDQPRTV